MMALLWDDIQADLTSAKAHFAQAVALYGSGVGDYVPSMAFQHAMQAGYTAFETAMKRLLHLLDEPLPVGPDWHAILVKRLGRAVEGHRPAVIDADLLGRIQELRRFRHVAMHAYDDFQPHRAALPVEAAAAFIAGIDTAMTTFRAAVDPA